MCAACDAWVAARHDPTWKAPKGRQAPRVKRPTLTARDRRDIRRGMNPGAY
jgi:hypothetical protein